MALTRGPQSDPTHTHAPVCPACACTTLALTRVERVRVRLRYYHNSNHAGKQGFCTVLVHGSRGLNSGPRRRLSVWLGHWPIPWVLGALLARFGALLGLCWAREMLGSRGGA